jgi:fatty acid elongase 3
VYFASYTYFTAKYFPYLPNKGKCAGRIRRLCRNGHPQLVPAPVHFLLPGNVSEEYPEGRKRSNTAKKAAIDLKNLEVPTVDKTVDAITHSNGSVKGSSNPSASGRSMSNGPVRDQEGMNSRRAMYHT